MLNALAEAAKMGQVGVVNRLIGKLHDPTTNVFAWGHTFQVAEESRILYISPLTHAFMLASASGYLNVASTLLENLPASLFTEETIDRLLKHIQQKCQSNLLDLFLQKIKERFNSEIISRVLTRATHLDQFEAILKLVRMTKGQSNAPNRQAVGSALKAAAENGHSDTVNSLFQMTQGQDNAPNSQAVGNAIKAAATKKKFDVANLLFQLTKGKDSELNEVDIDAVFWIAATYRQQDIAKTLIGLEQSREIARWDTNDILRLKEAIESGNWSNVFKILLDMKGYTKPDSKTVDEAFRSTLLCQEKDWAVVMTLFEETKGKSNAPGGFSIARALYEVLKADQLNIANTLLEETQDKDNTPCGWPVQYALLLAAYKGLWDIATVLLNSINLSPSDRDAGTLLKLATKAAQWHIVEKIIEIEPRHQVVSREEIENTLLIALDANQWNVVKKIITLQGGNKPRNVAKIYILRGAEMANQWDIIEEIINNINHKNDTYDKHEATYRKIIKNVLEHAAEAGQTKIVAALMSMKGLCEPQKEAVDDAFKNASIKGHWNIVIILLQQTMDKENQPKYDYIKHAFGRAARQGETEAVKAMLTIANSSTSIKLDLFDATLEALGCSKHGHLTFGIAKIPWKVVIAIIEGMDANNDVHHNGMSKIIPLALKTDKWDVVELIVNKFGNKISTSEKGMILDQALKNKQWGIIKTLIAIIQNHDERPDYELRGYILSAATRAMQWGLVELIIDIEKNTQLVDWLPTESYFDWKQRISGTIPGRANIDKQIIDDALHNASIEDRWGIVILLLQQTKGKKNQPGSQIINRVFQRAAHRSKTDAVKAMLAIASSSELIELSLCSATLAALGHFANEGFRYERTSTTWEVVTTIIEAMDVNNQIYSLGISEALRIASKDERWDAVELIINKFGDKIGAPKKRMIDELRGQALKATAQAMKANNKPTQETTNKAINTVAPAGLWKAVALMLQTQGIHKPSNAFVIETLRKTNLEDLLEICFHLVGGQPKHLGKIKEVTSNANAQQADFAPNENTPKEQLLREFASDFLKLYQHIRNQQISFFKTNQWQGIDPSKLLEHQLADLIRKIIAYQLQKPTSLTAETFSLLSEFYKSATDESVARKELPIGVKTFSEKNSNGLLSWLFKPTPSYKQTENDLKTTNRGADYAKTV